MAPPIKKNTILFVAKSWTIMAHHSESCLAPACSEQPQANMLTNTLLALAGTNTYFKQKWFSQPKLAVLETTAGTALGFRRHLNSAPWSQIPQTSSNITFYGWFLFRNRQWALSILKNTPSPAIDISWYFQLVSCKDGDQASGKDVPTATKVMAVMALPISSTHLSQLGAIFNNFPNIFKATSLNIKTTR